MKTTKLWKSCLALAACLAMSPLFLSCVEKSSSHYEGVHSFIVHAIPVSGNYGTADNPLPYPYRFGDYAVDVSAYAVDINGNRISDFNETVSLTAQPGQLDVTSLKFVNGEVNNQRVNMRFTHGTTRLWVEDTERKPVLINMPDGSIDVRSCPNNKYSEDGKFCEPSLATGTSELFTFQPQTIRMIQYNPDAPAGDSPLIRNYGQLKAVAGHDLVVTNVVSTGFYVTDLGDDSYNSIFIFTYSQPGRVDIGDRVCEVSGGVAEFTGMTQLQFPSWGIQNKERSTAEDIDPAPEDGEQGIGTCVDKETGETRRCTEEELEAMAAIVDCSDVYNNGVKLEGDAKKAFAYIEPPTPRVLSDNILDIANVDKLESLEGSIVTVTDVRLSTDFVNCDDNGNGKIESNSSESDCRTQCSSDSMTCTELSSLDSYDQWRAWTLSGNSEISVASTSLIANFNITSDCLSWIDPASQRQMMRCPERHFKRITGNLKQVLPTCSGQTPCDPKGELPGSRAIRSNLVMKVIEPRFHSDLVEDTAFNKAALDDFNACIRNPACEAACKTSGKNCSFAAFQAK
jgi:hypothetical protein